MKERYDVKAEKGGYRPWDLVWLYNPKRRRGYSLKLQSSWEGPYEVVTRINDVVYRIKKQPKGKPRVIHFNRLAPFKVQRIRIEEFRGEYQNPEDHLPVGGITTIDKDLFTMAKEYALAHCVAAACKCLEGLLQSSRGSLEKLKNL